jgi:hypothetical protein
MKIRALAVTAVALVAGTVLAILGPASPAVGFFSPPLLLDVQIQPTATLVARGAAVETRIEVTCAGAQYAYLTVSLTQRAGSDIATGSTNTTIGCSSQRETMLVLVTADSGKAFKKGTAVATAEIYACAYPVCGSEDDQETITLSQ